MFLFQPLEDQIRRDASMADLLAAIGNAFDFLKTNIESPEHLNPHQKSIAHLLTLQTVECAYFVQHYMEQTHFREFFQIQSMVSKLKLYSSFKGCKRDDFQH